MTLDCHQAVARVEHAVALLGHGALRGGKELLLTEEGSCGCGAFWRCVDEDDIHQRFRSCVDEHDIHQRFRRVQRDVHGRNVHGRDVHGRNNGNASSSPW